jgi:hypothetical protein
MEHALALAGGAMTRASLNRFSGRLPVILSLLAFALVVTALIAGWETHDRDEGAAAHLFQLLIAVQAPIVLVFLATADWRPASRPARVLALQFAALVLALAPVAIFRL